MINKYSILNNDVFLQVYYEVIYHLYQLINTLNFPETTYGNLREYQKKVLKIHQHQTIFFLQKNLGQSDISAHKNVVNVYISYRLDTGSRDLNTDFISGNCLFGAVKLTENADPDKYGYSRYDVRSQFLFSNGSWGKNVFIFGANMSSSENFYNKKKYISVLGEGLKQGLDDSTSTVEAKYALKYYTIMKKIVLNLHYNGSNCFLFDDTKIYQFKTKNSAIHQIFCV